MNLGSSTEDIDIEEVSTTIAISSTIQEDFELELMGLLQMDNAPNGQVDTQATSRPRIFDNVSYSEYEYDYLNNVSTMATMETETFTSAIGNIDATSKNE